MHTKMNMAICAKSSFLTKLIVIISILVGAPSITKDTRAEITIPDTVYSKTVTSTVNLGGDAMEGANISYTLLDSINNTQQLTREAITNAGGQDIVDSLPVLKHYTGIKDLKPDNYDYLIITNNGTGSDHLIRFKTKAESVSNEAYIMNMQGQQIAIVSLEFNTTYNTYDAVWKGENEEDGIYIFYAKTTDGIIASKIIHQENMPSLIDYGAGNDKKENASKTVSIDDAASKYEINITHESLEDFTDTVLVKENTIHDFLFNVSGIQYDDANVFGEIIFTEGGESPTDANVEYKQYFQQANTFYTTAPNGAYQIDVPVIYEPQNPGQTKYIVRITENGDLFITEIDTVLVSPGTNNFTHYVVASTQPPPDTVYSDTVTSNVLLDGEPFEGANISYTLLDSVSGFQELMRESITDANGQDIVDSLAVIEAETGLGASNYIIGITHEYLEDFFDTVLVQENTVHEFDFNVIEVGYDDGDIWGQIYFVDGGQSPTDANVEYKQLSNQTEVFSTTAPNGVYNIQVPVVFEQANPGQTQYIVTLTENGDPFVTKVDTVLVSPGSNGFVHFVVQIPPPEPEQDIEGIVRHVYTKNPESGVIVRVINRTTGELIEEVITSSDGAYEFLDIPQGTQVEFELGKPGELWMVNNEYDIPDEITDTIVVFNRYFYPATVEVPQVGTNTTIQGTGEEAAEMVGADHINFEEILRDIDNMWANGPGTGYWLARTFIQDNFYEGNSPITTVSTQRDITNAMQTDYEPYTNFYSGQLGRNVNFGSGNSTLSLLATTTYGVYAIMGGEIMTTGQLSSYTKEMQGRRLMLGTVNSRPSMMNAQATIPDEKDRAYVYMILINQDGRFDTDQETYSLENITSTEPTMQKRGEKYKDIPGVKPHSKRHFNWEKFEEQKRYQEQINE